MLNRLYAWPASKKIIVAIAGLLIVCTGFILVFALLLKNAEPANSEKAPIRFEYCEADPKDLCVLSFGRGGPQSSMINFFVVNKSFPNFYLIVKKAGTESRFNCIRNSEIKTSVLCSGPPLSLKQTIEINIHASRDDRLLAKGTFFIEAFLISTLNSQSTGTANIETQPSPSSEPTEPPALESPTPPTPTAEGSTTAYPDPSYP